MAAAAFGERIKTDSGEFRCVPNGDGQTVLCVASSNIIFNDITHSTDGRGGV